MAYPSPYAGEPPVYLVTGDKAVRLVGGQTINHLRAVGIPYVPLTPASMSWVTEKLDPAVEHPLTFN